jgi:hypothetical protein
MYEEPRSKQVSDEPHGGQLRVGRRRARANGEEASRDLRRFVAFATAWLVLVATSCTQTVRVPESEYDELRSEKRVYLDIRTHDARYRVTQFTATDSTLVIEVVDSGPSSYPARNVGFDQPPYLPFPVPLSSIESITRNETPSGASGVLIVLGLVVAVYAFAYWLFGRSMSGLASD